MYSISAPLLVLLALLIFTGYVESAPTFSSQPSNRDLSVVEGQDVTLQWTYNIDGTLLRATFSKGSSVVIEKDSSGLFLKASYTNRTRVNFITDSETSITLFKVSSTSDSGKYTFVIVNNNRKQVTSNVEIIFPALLTNVSGGQTISERSNLQLFCEASGKPTPNITWTKVLTDGRNSGVLHQGTTWDFTNMSRTDSGTYQCTAFNGLGGPDSRAINVNVTYPVKIVNFQREHIVTLEASVTLNCEAEGNPPPTYTWTGYDPERYVSDKSTLDISQVLNDAVYTCKVANKFTNSKDARNTSVFIGGNVINVTLVITSESCTDGKYNESSLSKKLSETMGTVFASSTSFESMQLKRVRCGSITVDLALKFNSTTKEQEVITILQNAAENGELGEFSGNPSSMKGTRPDVESTTAPTTSSSSSDITTWIIVAVVVGAVFFPVGVVIIWCLYKKKWSKKNDPREVLGNEEQDKMMEGDQEEGYALVDRSYPAVTSNANYRASNPSSVPPVTYEVAEKSARKGGTQRQEQAIPDYAVVDKTKKKKRTP